MELNNSIIDMVKTTKAEIFYCDHGCDHILLGCIIGQNEDSFIIKSDDFEKDVELPKKQVTKILWLKDMVTTSGRPPVGKKKKRPNYFSYTRWWKHDDVKEAEL